MFAREPLPSDSPLWDMPNVLVTPHIGGMSDIYAEQALPMLIENMRAFLDGRFNEMVNIVERRTTNMKPEARILNRIPDAGLERRWARVRAYMARGRDSTRS